MVLVYNFDKLVRLQYSTGIILLSSADGEQLQWLHKPPCLQGTVGLAEVWPIYVYGSEDKGT